MYRNLVSIICHPGPVILKIQSGYAKFSIPLYTTDILSTVVLKITLSIFTIKTLHPSSSIRQLRCNLSDLPQRPIADQIQQIPGEQE